MSGIRFTDEFKRDAVAQVVDRGYSVAEVSVRLGISTKSLYTWKTQFSQPRKQIIETTEQASEIRRLKKELGRVPKAMQQADKVKTLVSAGVDKLKIQEQLGISKASYYRCLKVA